MCLEEEIQIVKHNARNTEFGYNIAKGGIGGDTISNHPRHDEIVQNIKTSMSGENNPNYGKTGELSPLYGRHDSEETKHKKSVANRGKRRTLKERQNLSVRAKNRFKNPENHPMFGKSHSQESIEKNRENNRKTAAKKRFKRNSHNWLTKAK
jgi:hypothetical protein